MSADIWVDVLLRRARSKGAVAYVLREGDHRAGAVLLMVRDSSTGAMRLLREATRGDGDRVWMEPTERSSEADLQRYIDRAVRIDPDIWVVGIEDIEGRNFLMEPVEPAAPV